MPKSENNADSDSESKIRDHLSAKNFAKSEIDLAKFIIIYVNEAESDFKCAGL